MKKLFHANRIMKIICLLLTVGILSIIPSSGVYATEVDSHLTGSTEERTNIEEPGTASTPEELSELNIANTMTVTYNNGNGQVNGSLRILITLTLIALAPTLLIMLTSFTKVLIVLHFTRSALNTQTAPPNQVLIGLALFLTFFIMRPYMTQIYEEAVVPMEQGEIDQQEFFEEGSSHSGNLCISRHRQRMWMYLWISVVTAGRAGHWMIFRYRCWHRPLWWDS